MTIPCEHEYTESIKFVTPPKCVRFAIRFDFCSKCGSMTRTEKQRKKNDKNMRNAMNRFVRRTHIDFRP